jgi:hypothetical protein
VGECLTALEYSKELKEVEQSKFKR